MITGSNANRRIAQRTSALLIAIAISVLASTQLRADTGVCNGASLTLPFTDVPAVNGFFCSIAQAFFTGLTNGTTPTTYSPAAIVTRDQMAAFITRTQDSALKRGGRRAIAGQWATPQDIGVLKTTIVGGNPQFNCFDGEDIWVANSTGDSITQVHASDGRVLGTWTGANLAHNTIAAGGFIYVTGRDAPGRIYRIDPRQTPGAVTEVGSNLGNSPVSITFDGLSLWTANEGAGAGLGSISNYDIEGDTVTSFTTGFNRPAGIVFDGIHLWVVDSGNDELYRVNPENGAILETFAMGQIDSPFAIPCFDGSNIWVPVNNGIQVVSTSTPARVLATLTGNGLSSQNREIAFDGERMMVTVASPPAVSLWRATSLTPLGTVNLGAGNFPIGVCSDGLHFWIVINPSAGDFLLRF